MCCRKLGFFKSVICYFSTFLVFPFRYYFFENYAARLGLSLKLRDKEIKHRVCCARENFTQYCQFLQNQNITLKTQAS